MALSAIALESPAERGHELLPWQHAASFQNFPELSTALK